MKSSKVSSPPVEVIYERYSLRDEMREFLEDLWDAYAYSKEVKAKKRLNESQRQKIMGIQKIILNAVVAYTQALKNNSEYELNARELVIVNDMDKFGDKMMELMDEIDREYICGKMHRLRPFIAENKVLVQKSAMA